jgi:hypothetical protein
VTLEPQLRGTIQEALGVRENGRCQVLGCALFWLRKDAKFGPVPSQPFGSNSTHPELGRERNFLFPSSLLPGAPEMVMLQQALLPFLSLVTPVYHEGHALSKVQKMYRACHPVT